MLDEPAAEIAGREPARPADRPGLYRVTARTDMGLTLTCKRLIEVNGTLTVTGSEVTVYTFQFDVAGLGWAEVAPSIAVDDDIPVMLMGPETRLYCLFPVIGTCALP